MDFGHFHATHPADVIEHLGNSEVVLGADSPENRDELRGIFKNIRHVTHETEGRRPTIKIVSQKIGILKHSKKLAIKWDWADEDDPLLARGWMAYEVVEKAPDGHGLTLLHLHELGKSCIGRQGGGFPYVLPLVFGSGADDCINIDDSV